MIELSIAPFDPNNASKEEWKMLHEFLKVRHNETQPNVPNVSENSLEETMKIIPKRLNILRFNVFEKDDATKQIGDVYFSYYKDGTDENTAMVNSSVLGQYRHQGIGVQLLYKIAELAKKYNKSRLIFQSTEDDGIIPDI